MKIFVSAKPNAKEETVIRIDETHMTVAVKEPPVKGRANAAIAKSLAAYFHKSPWQVRLVSGFASRQKVFEIL